MNDYRQQQAQSIDRQVPLATGDFLGRIVTSLFASLGSANRLTVNNGHRGSRFLAGRLAHFFSQGIVNLSPSTVVSPVPENAVDRVPVGKIVRQHRHWQPVRTIYNMALMIRRRDMGRRPNREGGGNNW